MSYAKKLNDAACITTAGACVVHFENAQSIGEEADAEIAKLRKELEEARKVIEEFYEQADLYRVPLSVIAAARAFLAAKETKG